MICHFFMIFLWGKPTDKMESMESQGVLELLNTASNPLIRWVDCRIDPTIGCCPWSIRKAEEWWSYQGDPRGNLDTNRPTMENWTWEWGIQARSLGWTLGKDSVLTATPFWGEERNKRCDKDAGFSSTAMNSLWELAFSKHGCCLKSCFSCHQETW